MVAKNPLFSRKWNLKLLGTTVIDDIWPEIIFFTLVATTVVLVSRHTGVDLAISNQMLTVLGIVLGLVVSFRTSSAYDRYWEGRRLWTNIDLASRNLAHFLWIHIPNERPVSLPDGVKKEDDSSSGSEAQRQILRTIIEKKTMINLVQAFSVAVKHMLRGEPGIYYEDLYPLVCFLPKYATECRYGEHATVLPLWDQNQQASRADRTAKPAVHRSHSEPTVRQKDTDADAKGNGATEKDDQHGWFHGLRRSHDKKRTFDPEKVLPSVPSDHPLAPARMPPKTSIYDYLPILLIFKPVIALIKFFASKLHGKLAANDIEPFGGVSEESSNHSRAMLGRKKRPTIVESNVPLEITLFLSSYLAWLQRNGYVQSPATGEISGSIGSLQDAYANLHRIRSTPIPFAYQAHLRMSMWLYLLFLPFQVVSSYGYLVIPATAFASFMLLGFLEIGQEIEDPFGYDYNDLDVDRFCLTIQRKLHEITAHPAPDPHSFIFGKLNQPFAPADRRSATELLKSDHEYYDPDTGEDSIRRTMLKNWKEVVDVTIPRR